MTPYPHLVLYKTLCKILRLALLQYRDLQGKANFHFSNLRAFLEQNVKKRLQIRNFEGVFCNSGRFYSFFVSRLISIKNCSTVSSILFSVLLFLFHRLFFFLTLMVSLIILMAIFSNVSESILPFRLEKAPTPTVLV